MKSLNLTMIMVMLEAAGKFAMAALGVGGFVLALSGVFRTWPYPNSNLLDFAVRLGFGVFLMVSVLVWFWRKRRE